MSLGKRIRALREKLGITQEQLSELSGVEIGTISALEVRNSARSKYAPKLAEALGVSLDVLFSDDMDADKVEIPSLPPVNKRHIVINQFDAKASMGTGLDLPDQPGLIKDWHVDKRWLDLNVRSYSSVKNLCIVTGFGDSMKGLFNPGDPILVDLGVKTVEADDVYFFRIGNQGYIKHLQRIPTENGLILKAISENSKLYKPFDITEKMDFQVIGKVLIAWNGTKF